MKNRLPAFLLPIILLTLLAFPLTALQAQWREPQSTQTAILNASPELKKHYANVFMNAFKNLCIANIDQPQQLLAQLQNARQLPPDLADQFLNGASGRAWTLENSKENGIHFLSTMNDHYYCSVHTMAADPAEMERLFDEITATAPADSEFSLLNQEKVEQANGNTMHRKSYTLTHKDSPVVIQLTIITNTLSQKDAPQGTVFMLIDQI